MNTARVATVTNLYPFQIQVSGEAAPLNLKPVCLVDAPHVGDAVWIDWYGTQLVVLGRIGDGSSLPQLGNTEDFNNFLWTGRWGQTLNVNTDTARNYPVAKAGLLEVFRVAPDGHMVHQRYSTYDGVSVWWRTYYNTSGWSAWVLVTTTMTANVAVASGWTVRSGYGFTVTRLTTHTALVNGCVQNTSGATVTTATLANAGGFPAWAYAPSTAIQTVTLTGNGIVSSTSTNAPGVEIHNDGSATAYGLSLAANGYMSINGVFNTV